MKRLMTTIDVIEQLGGNDAVAKLLKTNGKAVANWRYFGIFPANTADVLREALKKQRCEAPKELWNMKPGASP